MIESYTSANALPVKLFCCPEAARLKPIHIQFLPTNACNLRCNFCSCSERDRGLSMDWAKVPGVIRELHHLGCKAVTITGGGEPLMYPHINDTIWAFTNVGIKVGLVTNGELLYYHTGALRDVTWCRISHADDRPFTQDYAKMLDAVVVVAPLVDWAFSYVVGQSPNLDNIKRVVKFANERNFTHVRLVGDILYPEGIDWQAIRATLAGID